MVRSRGRGRRPLRIGTLFWTAPLQCGSGAMTTRRVRVPPKSTRRISPKGLAKNMVTQWQSSHCFLLLLSAIYVLWLCGAKSGMHCTCAACSLSAGAINSPSGALVEGPVVYLPSLWLQVRSCLETAMSELKGIQESMPAGAVGKLQDW